MTERLKLLFSGIYFVALVIALLGLFAAGCASIDPIMQDVCNTSEDICRIAATVCEDPPDQTLCNIAGEVCFYAGSICSIYPGNLSDPERVNALNQLQEIDLNLRSSQSRPVSVEFWKDQKTKLETIYNLMK